jgi:ribose transport system permease protein
MMNLKKLLKEYNREFGLVAALIFMTALFGSINPLYLSIGNVTDIINQTTIYGLMALGMTFIIISGGIDLSVGAVLAFIGVVVSKMAVAGVNPFLCIAAGVAIGLAIGAINGFAVAKMKLQPFVATLGMMSIVRGFAFVISGGYPIINIPTTYRKIIDGIMFSGVRSSVLIFLLFAVICHILLKQTRFGNYVYAIGGNEESTRLSGVNVDWYKIMIYAVGVSSTALAALVQLGKLGTGEASAGQGYELNAIAAVAIGGASMAGGRGGIIGTVLGALLFSGLKNGLIVVGVDTFWQYVATGLVIVIAAYGEKIQAKLSEISKERIKPNPQHLQSVNETKIV